MRGQITARLAIGAVVFTGMAAAQADHKLTARELFYTPVAEVKARPAEVKAPADRPKISTAKAKRPARPPQSPGAEVATKSRTQPSEAEEPAKLQLVSMGGPLALRYSVLKNTGDSYEEVDPSTAFRSGDKIKVAVSSNDRGHLYIVHQGSTRVWSLLFPNEETEGGSNIVEPNHTYELPAGGRFTFDENPGEERLFIVLTRQPVPDIESLIYGLSKTPASAKQESGHRTLLAQAKFDDGMISKLRDGMLARDLVFEKVDETKPAVKNAPAREKAVYVATQDGGPQARVVVDLTLIHR